MYLKPCVDREFVDLEIRWEYFLNLYCGLSLEILFDFYNDFTISVMPTCVKLLKLALFESVIFCELAITARFHQEKYTPSSHL